MLFIFVLSHQIGRTPMKNLLIDDLQPGMVTAETIYTDRGQMVMDANTTLTPELISKLSYYSIRNVPIKEPDDAPVEQISKTEDSEKNSDAQEHKMQAPTWSRAANPSYAQRVKAKPEFMKFQIEYSKILNSLREIFDGIIANPKAPVNVQYILKECSNLVASCQTSVEMFDKLHNMRLNDDSVYSHCLNVALIAMAMGKWMRFSSKELELVALCGLFHDIGKTSIPDEILNKCGKYTDEEFKMIKQHPLFSYKLLKALPMDDHIKKAALQHHERCDGSGYPQGLTTDEIDNFAHIIAIADVYDAMTAARSYRSPLCPFQVIDIFEKDGLQKYHPKYILTFLKRIANSYQRNRVLLNNGWSANIVMINPHHLTRPMLQLDDGSVIDMLSKPELEIIKII